jgi:carbon monoxide dehydrogenase subunit G
MSLKFEETFELQAPIDRVWAYLSDPRQVVTCLPGAELTSVESDTTFLGKVKVKVGPVTAAYNGRVTITERDVMAYVVRLVGDGRESSGGGSAKMTMSSTLVALPTGATEVRVTADLDIVGRLAQFGRGMIESVNKQMFRQFTECVRATLETGSASAPGTDAPSTHDASAARGAGVVSPSGSASVAPPTASMPARAAEEPVRLLPIVLRAGWENLVRVSRTIWGLIARLGRRGE